MFLGEPQKLREQGFERTAQLTVQLGNTLRYLGFEFEKGPNLYQPVGERPRSIYALAMQFREVGLDLWGKKPTDPWAARIQEQLEVMHTRLKNLEVKTVKGGAK